MKYKKTMICLSIAAAAVALSWKDCDCVFENIVQTFEPQSLTEYRLNEIFSRKVQKITRENLTCHPEKPLSQEQLFEISMQDYFRYMAKLTWLHDTDGYARESMLSSRSTFFTEACNLQRDACGNAIKMGNPLCFPQKIENYLTFESLKERIAEFGDVSNYKYLLEEVLFAKLYTIDSKPPLYSGEFYNKNTNFSVLHSSSSMIYFYPHDCCRLLSYEELLEDYTIFKIKKEIFFESISLFRNPNYLFSEDKRLKNRKFLRVSYYQVYGIDDVEGSVKNLLNNGGILESIKRMSQKLYVSHYDISDCGNILNFCANCGIGPVF